MQVGKVQVGTYRGGVAGIPMSQEDRDKLREKRNLGLQKMKTLGLAKLGISVLTVAVGIATLVVSGRGSRGWPIFNFGPAVVGVLMFIAGLLAVFAGKKVDEIKQISVEETPTSVKGLFIGWYVMCVTCITFCTLAGTFGFLSAAFCGGGTDPFQIYCYPDKDANIALGVIGGILCVILAILCLFSCIFFCLYARSFGFKNRYERAMEYQMGMMMRAMQEQQQQQGQFQGQAVQGQGQRGYSDPPPSYY